jgi:hypothetical protein
MGSCFKIFLPVINKKTKWIHDEWK